MTNPSPGLPHPVRRVSPTSPNSAAITSSMLPIPMRRVIPGRRTGSELLRLHRLTDIAPMQSGDCFSYRNAGSEFPGFPNQCGESYSDRQALRRASPAFPNCPNLCGELSPKVTQFAELRSEQKKLTALTIGNEGIQMQWHSRAHTRKHEAALPPVLMFFL